MGFSFQRRARGVRRRLAVAIVLGMAGGLAQGTTYTVNTTNDAPAGSTSCTGLGACNLRDAIDAANRHAGPDTVNFVAGLSGTITLGQGPNAGEIAITDDLTLAGPGADLLSLSGNSASRVFHIAVGAPEDPAGQGDVHWQRLLPRRDLLHPAGRLGAGAAAGALRHRAALPAALVLHRPVGLLPFRRR